ncbi:hypothetical protein H5410_002500 [Solanum commersonii]|uniref:Uncharacterized protein n=1 Tax=Solanum commersonii TaxID=4109 RepID=A0A9J6B305_SOLCO|nr:hypothetical protein H5410_002500 [Solanum commersonii]
MGASGNLAGAHQAANESIYYNTCFKSYEITRFKNGAEGKHHKKRTTSWVDVVGKIQSQAQETLSLNDVRRWACNLWISAIEVNKSGRACGRWIWKKMKLDILVEANHWMLAGKNQERLGLDNINGVTHESMVQKVFPRNWKSLWRIHQDRASLKNHLHWAKIKVRGDSSTVPKKVEVTNDEFTFTISMWFEIPMTVRMSEKKREERGKYPMDINQTQSGQGYLKSLSVKFVEGHMGTSSEGERAKVVPISKESAGKRKDKRGLDQNEVLGPFKDPITWEQIKSAETGQDFSIINIKIAAISMEQSTQAKLGCEGKEKEMLAKIKRNKKGDRGKQNDWVTPKEEIYKN